MPKLTAMVVAGGELASIPLTVSQDAYCHSVNKSLNVLS